MRYYGVLLDMPNYNNYKSDYSIIKRIISLFSPNDTTKIENIVRDNFLYKVKVNGWADNSMQNSAREIIENRKIFFAKLLASDSVRYLNLSAKMMNYFFRDSVFIESSISRVDSIFESSKEEIPVQSSQRNPFVNVEKQRFSDSLYDSLLISFNEIYDKEFKKLFLTQFEITSRLLKKRIGYRNYLDSAIAKIDTFQIRDFTLPNISVKLRLKDALDVSLPLMLLLSVYIQILYLNFKSFEYKITSFAENSARVPSIKNIYLSFWRSKFISKLVAILTSVLVNIGFPLGTVVIFLFVLRNMLSQPYFYFLMGIFLITHMYLLIKAIKFIRKNES